MKSSQLVLTLAAIAGFLGSSAVAADTANNTTTQPARLRNGPPPNAEMQAYHKLVLAIYDADKNGTLDDTEREVLREDIAAGEMEPPPRPHGRHPRMGPPPEILEHYDTDKDGTLNETERAALEADIASGKLPPPPPRGDFPVGEPTPPASTSASNATKS